MIFVLHCSQQSQHPTTKGKGGKKNSPPLQGAGWPKVGAGSVKKGGANQNKTRYFSRSIA